MPFGILNQTDAEPLFAPLVSSGKLSGSIYDYEVWETLCRIGKADQVLENVHVVEGLTGIHFDRNEASLRGIKHGKTLDVYISTYDAIPIGHLRNPMRFLIQPTAYVHEGRMVHGDIDYPNVNPLSLSSPVLGLNEILHLFDIVHGSGTIEADDDGHLHIFDKDKIKGSDVIIRKKAGVQRPCFRS